MKHLATIQSEFLKEARKWEDMSYDEQKAYLQQHRKSKRKLTAKPGKDTSDLKSKIDKKMQDVSTKNKVTNEPKNEIKRF